MAPQWVNMLVDEGVLTASQLDEAIKESRTRGESLVRTLVGLGMVAEEKLLRLVARQQGLEFISLRNTPSLPPWPA
jgi:predicted transcriptional regulator